MMSSANKAWLKRSFLSVALLAAAGFPRLVQGQGAPPVRVGEVDITGIPQDWSHGHVVFSNPGAGQEAIQSGRYEQWQKVVSEPRYVLQQLRKNAPVQGPAAIDAEYRSRWDSEASGVRAPLETSADDLFPGGEWPRYGRPDPFNRHEKPSLIQKDWSESLGGTGLAAGHSPAKYSFSTTTASCSDYVVFPTGAASSTTQATIIAFDNLYVGSGGCETSAPTVFWAYYTPPSAAQCTAGTGTGATIQVTANTSPVLSLNGAQVAFVENCSGTGTGGTTATSFLVLLRVPALGTTPPAGTAYNNPVTATYEAPGSYFGCTAPCYTTLSLGAADANSAPFYNYNASGISADTIFVGDSVGKVHYVTPVFNGSTPAIDPGGSGWPVTVANAANDGTFTSAALTSPVYDSISQNVFVADASGYQHQFQGTGSPGTVYTSNRLACATGGFSDGPIVDSTTEEFYAFIGDGCDEDAGANPGNSYVNQFAIGSSTTVPPPINASYGNYVSFGNHSTNDTGTVQHAGSFDNLYYVGAGTTGNLYSCVNGALYQVPVGNFSSDTALTAAFNTSVSTVADASTCAPVTEFLGAKANTTLSASLASPTLTTTTTTEAMTARSATVTVSSVSGITAGSSYIQIGGEDMLVTAVNAGTDTLTLTRSEFGSPATAHASGATVTVLASSTFGVASTAGIAVGDFVEVGSEIMYVTAVSSPNLTVWRGVLGTVPAAYSSGAAVQDMEDWLFTSVDANGNGTGCSGTGSAGACLYNYNVTTGAATGAAVAGQAAAGGTSGIIIDNLSTTQVGAEQIYYNLLSGTTNNAIQASQSAP